MPIPDFQTIMLPLLQFYADKKEHKLRDSIEHISQKFHLTEAEKNERLPSGQQTTIANRVGWSKTYLKKAGLLQDPRRGYAIITEKGLEVLRQNPERIDIPFLNQFKDFQEFREIEKEAAQDEVSGSDQVQDETPDELMERGQNLIIASLAQDLLERLRSTDPYYFETIVGKLLTAMGYGTSNVTQKSNDGGVDGIVNQDKLGLDKIYFQAKRYHENNAVTAKDVRDFIGTLTINGADKGIFITTSKFPKNTQEIITRTPKHIVMIDGTRLAKLMIEYDVGVSTEKIYKVKKIDSDFFAEE